MTGDVTGEKFKVRAGTRMLLNLAAGLDYRGLREAALEGIPGLPPAPPGSLPEPEELEQAEVREQAEFRDEFERTEAPGVDNQYVVTTLGEDLIRAHQTLERWLGERPAGRPPDESLMAEALGPLLCGWSGTIIHAIAPVPLTLEELDRAVAPLDRQGTRKCVERMVRSGFAEASIGGGQVRYGLTDWGRAAIAPLLAVVLYERRHDEEFALPPDVFDAETAFQMALPLLRLPPWLRGNCRLGVEIPGEEALMAGATARLDRGVVVSSSALREERSETFVTGDALGWCETVIDPTADKLHIGGDTELAEALLAALHERLFG